MDAWYFAYGSNLWLDQMIARTGAIGRPDQPPKIARLAEHRVVFQRLEKNGPAYANILTPGDGVLGVVYRCQPADLDKLDDFERGYERQRVVLTDQQDERLEAVVYVMTSAHEEMIGRPSPEYLQRIVTGARQHRLPEEYINGIVNIAAL